MALCLAALTTIGVAAKADFVAYNDFCTNFTADANVTHISTTTGAANELVLTSATPLKNYSTGTNLPVTMAIANMNGNPTGGGPGGEMAAGTDAQLPFGGKVATSGQVIWYGIASAWYVDLTFANLNPAASYTFAGTLDRGNATYDNKRWTAISITGADASTYASSAGAYKVDDSKVSIDAYNTNRGYVAKWTDINPGSDGSFSIRFTYATTAEIPAAYQAGASAGYGYGPAGIMLQESAVPEPTALSLLAVGGLLLGRRRA
jgi:hypothetical protein